MMCTHASNRSVVCEVVMTEVLHRENEWSWVLVFWLPKDVLTKDDAGSACHNHRMDR